MQRRKIPCSERNVLNRITDGTNIAPPAVITFYGSIDDLKHCSMTNTRKTEEICEKGKPFFTTLHILLCISCFSAANQSLLRNLSSTYPIPIVEQSVLFLFPLFLLSPSVMYSARPHVLLLIQSVQSSGPVPLCQLDMASAFLQGEQV